MYGHTQPFVSGFDYGRVNCKVTRIRQQQKSNLWLSKGGIPTGCEMKADMLANRLKYNSQQSTNSISRKTLSHLDEYTNNNQIYAGNSFESKIRKGMLLMQTSHKKVYDNLVALRESVWIKSKKVTEENQIIQNQIKVELQIIAYSLQQMTLLASKQCISPQFNMYSDILMQLQLLQPIVLNKSTKHINSPNFDRSLLFSCKKQNEEDEDYATLKYSDQSNFRRQQLQSEPSAEEDKINMGCKGQTKTRGGFKEKVELHQINTNKHAYNEQQANPRLWMGLHCLKDELIDGQVSIKKALQNYEAVLQRLIEEIAQQKVESKLSWNSILVFTEQSFEQIVDSLAQLSANTNTHEYQFDQSFNRLQQSLNSNLFIQSQTRKQQQHITLKLLLQIVDGLQ